MVKFALVKNKNIEISFPEQATNLGGDWYTFRLTMKNVVRSGLTIVYLPTLMVDV